MDDFFVREANADELDEIYLMGMDAWNEGLSEEDYLLGCRNSVKYRNGAWLVLIDAENRIVSSLMTHKFENGSSGIGSIATAPDFRHRGLASRLISEALSRLDAQFGSSPIFLYADIDPEFYERFGFLSLPSELQNHNDSTCMVRGIDLDMFARDSGTTVPRYF